MSQTETSIKKKMAAERVPKKSSKLKSKTTTSKIAKKAKTSCSCKTCGQAFDLRKHLILHMKEHDHKKQYTCHLCPKMFSRSDHLKNHILRHLHSGKHPCDQCEEVFKRADHLKYHKVNAHGNTLSLKDLRSYSRSSASTSLTKHRNTQCEICGKSFTDEKTLKIHNKSHSSSPQHECQYCGKSFSQRSNLNVHIRKHTGAKPYQCETCGEGFSTSCKLKTHDRKHTGELPFVCDTCGKRFGEGQLLKMHMRIHENLKAYVCSHCGKSFTHSSTLRSHIRTHTGAKPYKCDLCQESFAQISSLTYHRRIHTGEKPFVCDFCGNKYTRRTTLNAHLTHHTGEKLLSCKQCDFKCNASKQLRRHMSQSHHQVATDPTSSKNSVPGKSKAVSSVTKSKSCAAETFAASSQEPPYVNDIDNANYSISTCSNNENTRHDDRSDAVYGLEGGGSFFSGPFLSPVDMKRFSAPPFHPTPSSVILSSTNQEINPPLSLENSVLPSSWHPVLNRPNSNLLSIPTAAILRPQLLSTSHTNSTYPPNHSSRVLDPRNSVVQSDFPEDSTSQLHAYEMTSRKASMFTDIGDMFSPAPPEAQSQMLTTSTLHGLHSHGNANLLQSLDLPYAHSDHRRPDLLSTNTQQDCLLPPHHYTHHSHSSFVGPDHCSPDTIATDDRLHHSAIDAMSNSESEIKVSTDNTSLPITQSCITPNDPLGDRSEQILKERIVSSDCSVNDLATTTLSQTSSTLASDIRVGKGVVPQLSSTTTFSPLNNTHPNVNCDEDSSLPPSSAANQTPFSLSLELKKSDDEVEGEEQKDKRKSPLSVPASDVDSNDKVTEKGVEENNANKRVNIALENVATSQPIDDSIENGDRAIENVKKETSTDIDLSVKEEVSVPNQSPLSTTENDGDDADGLDLQNQDSPQSPCNGINKIGIENEIVVSSPALCSNSIAKSKNVTHENTPISCSRSRKRKQTKNNKSINKEILPAKESSTSKKSSPITKDNKQDDTIPIDSKIEIKSIPTKSGVKLKTRPRGGGKVRGRPKKDAQSIKETEETRHICKVCEHSFVKQSNLITHMKLHSGRKAFQCPHCGREFNRAHHLSDHVVLHSKAKNLKCLHCFNIFQDTKQLQEHIEKSHNGIFPYRCNSCKFSCLEVMQLKGHITQYHETSDFSCHVCKSNFQTSDDIKAHVKVEHPDEQPFTCQECGLVCRQNSMLKLHVLKKHNGAKLFACGICSETFISAAILRRHVRKHTGDKPFVCDVCKKSFLDAKLLRLHTRIHNGERPYQCSYCGCSFTHSSTLCAHVRIHTGNKPFKCDVCGDSFTQSASLTQHQQTHNRQIWFTCHICGKSYTRMATLNIHLLNHSGKSRFLCQHCAYKTNKSAALRRHMEKAHNLFDDKAAVPIGS